jgi:hypothetical protein
MNPVVAQNSTTCILRLDVHDHAKFLQRSYKVLSGKPYPYAAAYNSSLALLYPERLSAECIGATGDKHSWLANPKEPHIT